MRWDQCGYRHQSPGIEIVAWYLYQLFYLCVILKRFYKKEKKYCKSFFPDLVTKTPVVKMELIGGSSFKKTTTGRVVLKVADIGEGAVCATSVFTQRTANVACRSLGYMYGEVS